MGLDINLASKNNLGEVEYVDWDDSSDRRYLSRSLCYAYCDYDNTGKESILYRSIKAMQLDPEPLFRMEYFRYGELSYLDFLLSDAESEEERSAIRAKYEADTNASWQPIEEIAALMAKVKDYISRQDVATQMYISDDYKPYFVRNDATGHSEFETDMLNLLELVELAQSRGRKVVSFDMG
jgi:hypothetical protein